MIKFTLLGRPFRLVFRRLKKVDGDCTQPNGDAVREIRICKGLSEERELDVTIHEALHGCGWHIDEEFVARAATDIARLLVLAGWRKGKDGD